MGVRYVRLCVFYNLQKAILLLTLQSDQDAEDAISTLQGKTPTQSSSLEWRGLNYIVHIVLFTCVH